LITVHCQQALGAQSLLFKIAPGDVPDCR